MTKAKVELVGSASHSGGGRKLIKGQPQLITNLSEINYYKGQSGVTVTMIEEVAPQKAKVKTPSKVEVKQKAKVETKVAKYTQENLKGVKKAGLIEIAAELGVFLDGTEKKKEMIVEILEAQQG